MISNSEKTFVQLSAVEGVRYDGRGLLDLRHLNIELGIHPLANGSARVSRAYSASQAVCAVKLQVVEAKSIEDGALEVSVDLSGVTDANPGLGLSINLDLSKQQQEKKANFLANSLKRTLNSVLPRDELIIGKEQGCAKYMWKLFVDIVVEETDGNLEDLISLAAYSAIRDTRKPKVTVFKSEKNSAATAGAEYDFEVDADPLNAEPLIEGILEKICVRLTMFELSKGIFVADASEIEESCALSAFSVVLNKSGYVCGAQILGKKGALNLGSIKTIVETCKEIGTELFKLLDKELDAE
eukprot:CAMPEP_0184044674 /NCGR_PEP_ID=MMETSP0956-20121227/422_1 /TAXON_ID=627963 /ORGANISM="Aplanochytrium sp, Strain PBS07" /LENGTH=297 /DNA_ID=CAMNT_0026335753 /DNA_START=92 /DNA_END=985 /DNA_ORIENTATION=+